jgi:predicted outer membrane protein
MRKISFILTTSVAIATSYSCSRVFSSAGNEASLRDSTFTNRSIVGNANTPGTPRINDYREMRPPITATPNTTGPTPAASDMADYQGPTATANNRANPNEIKRFVQLMAYNRLAEVQLSLLASSKSKNPKLAAYAEELVKDQNNIAADLKLLAAVKKTGIADINEVADEKLSNSITGLDDTAADKFDQTYIKLLSKEHRNAVQILKQGTDFKDDAIQQFSKKYLPVMQLHKNRLESL